VVRASQQDDLSPRIRAEDILLGALGFGEHARIVTIHGTNNGYPGYAGVGTWPDGTTFTFESEEPLTALEQWALAVLVGTP